MVKKIFLFLLLCVPLFANAALFGASSYEECMSDGKVGRTNAEVRILKNKCEKKFPKLLKVSKKTNATLNCVNSSGKSIIELTISGDAINSGEQKLKIITRDTENIFFKGRDATNNNNENYGSLNFLNGDMKLSNQNKFTNIDNWIDFFTCVEK